MDGNNSMKIPIHSEKEIKEPGQYLFWNNILGKFEILNIVEYPEQTFGGLVFPAHLGVAEWNGKFATPFKNISDRLEVQKQEVKIPKKPTHCIACGEESAILFGSPPECPRCHDP